MISVDIKDHKRLGQMIERGMREKVTRGLLSAGIRLVSYIQNEIIPSEPRPPIFDRHYGSGFRADPIEGGAEVVNTIPYAAIVEYGARAANIKVGTAMINALTEWVKRKGLAKGGSVKRVSGKTQAVDENAEARSIAWAIAMSMKKSGIFNGGKGLRILEKARTRKLAEFIRQEVAREMSRGVL